MIRFLKVFIIITIIMMTAMIITFFLTADAKAHWKPGTHNTIHAIQLAFCGKSNRVCHEGNEAIRVGKCEAAQYWTWNIPHKAVNGQYRGVFQMGRWERRTYGHGPDPWKQAFAAFRYFVASGRDWSPWECKP